MAGLKAPPPVNARILTLAALAAFSATGTIAQILPPGTRPSAPSVHALTGARIVVKPGTVIDSGTIVIRNGLIESVGANVAVPPDARVWDLKSNVVYAGFIDAHLVLVGSNAPVSTAAFEPVDRAAALTSGAGNYQFFGTPNAAGDAGQSGPGAELATIAPERRVAATFAPPAKTLQELREIGFTTGNVVPDRGILRGTSAFVSLSGDNPNDAVIKPDVFQHIAFEVNSGPGRSDVFPGSLMGVIAAVRQTFFDAQHYALDQANYATNATGRKRPPFNPALDALRFATDKKVQFVFEPGSAVMVDRTTQLSKELGLQPLILSSGQEWRRPDLAKASGAAFIVPLNFPEAPKFPEDDDWHGVSLDQLRALDWAPSNPSLLRSNGLDIALTTYGLGDKKTFRKNLQSAVARGLSEDDALAALTTVPAKLCGVDKQLGSIEAGKLANLTIVEGTNYFVGDAKVREVWIDGRVFEPAPAAPKKAPPATNAVAKADAKPDTKAEAKKAETKALQAKRVARQPLELKGVLTNPPAVYIKSATIWTSGEKGILTNAPLLVMNGKIMGVGAIPRIALPPGTVTIDLPDIHVTAGLIDCHSHSMILGGVNEGTLPSTSMVRIGDVVNSEADTIHQQLAGGLTVANLLHGSANPIGGQNQVIKLREGEGPEDLKFKGAPQGIKFALGENVKQANWGDRFVTRFPQTRMGVPAFYINRFTAAQQYEKEWADFRAGKTSVPPRRNLELEAIGEIIAGTRLIHCHSYRQDEILVFLRTMEQFGVKVGTLQHILEGYKVADEIAKHGAGASAFSDWWAYKFEVLDAIPHAGSLMRDRGVLVSFNSDSSDLARRMNLEAAKAVKYGNTPEAEALKFVTINPAKQLRIDQWVGSLENGKDGDFAIWSGHPLSTSSVCLQTWIEGKKYFDRDIAKLRGEALKAERLALLDKVKKLAGDGAGPDKGSEAARAAFFLRALETSRHLGVEMCQDCELPMRN